MPEPEWSELRGILKVAVLLVRCFILRCPPRELQFSNTIEADAALGCAVALGWRGLACKIIEVRPT
jgi:hypothetical protein